MELVVHVIMEPLLDNNYVRVDNYISQLSVSVTSDIVGKTDECVHESYQNDSTTVSVVGYFMIHPIAGILCV